MLICVSVGLYMLDAYAQLYAASAAGAMMPRQYPAAVVFPLFALQMYKAPGVGWATSMLGFLTLVMAPVPWCFQVHGERFRKKSKLRRALEDITSLRRCLIFLALVEEIVKVSLGL